MPTPRPAAQSFGDLVVWQKAHQFVLSVYRLTESFPDREKFGLSHQMRRAAVSVPANIAEGFGKRSQAEKARFLNIAEGSLEECRYYLILAHDLGYGQTDSLTVALEEVSRLLNAYARAILASGSSPVTSAQLVDSARAASPSHRVFNPAPRRRRCWPVTSAATRRFGLTGLAESHPVQSGAAGGRADFWLLYPKDIKGEALA